mmetsp:Transcript_58003/g.184252  ORF Transcript_58003/g.184252 Transcript_58003/m.184252 type:complete len:343 (-) Transcript_58003:2992-4020(-)
MRARGILAAADPPHDRPRAQQAVDNIVKRLEAEKEQSDSKAYGRGYVRAPDPEEAKRGRIDYVKIKDWGSGNPDDMGELEVESVGEQFLEADPKRPFYEQLCLRLQVHERNGDLRIAAPKDGRAIPPFEKWSYGLSAYLGYLDGQQLVHAALEKALAAAASAEEGGETCRAVALLDERLGLHRSEAIERDIAAITRESTIPVPQPPNQMAVAYARYLFGLGREAVEATEEGERERARLRLLTNAFCMHVSHLTTGVRVGAQATERFDLIGKGAVATYMDFPESVPNPIAALVRAVNLAGLELGSAGLLECAMEELPKAMPKVSLLLSPLAVEGPSGEDPDLN